MLCCGVCVLGGKIEPAFLLPQKAKVRGLTHGAAPLPAGLQPSPGVGSPFWEKEAEAKPASPPLFGFPLYVQVVKKTLEGLS